MKQDLQVEEVLSIHDDGGYHLQLFTGGRAVPQQVSPGQRQSKHQQLGGQGGFEEKEEGVLTVVFSEIIIYEGMLIKKKFAFRFVSIQSTTITSHR